MLAADATLAVPVAPPPAEPWRAVMLRAVLDGHVLFAAPAGDLTDREPDAAARDGLRDVATGAVPRFVRAHPAISYERATPRRVLAALFPPAAGAWRDVPLLVVTSIDGDDTGSAEETNAAGALHADHAGDPDAQAEILAVATGVKGGALFGGGARRTVSILRAPRAVAVGAAFQDARDHARALAAVCHGVSRRAGYWTDPVSGECRRRPMPEAVLHTLAHLSAGAQAHLRGERDPRLPGRPVLEVRAAEALADLLDMAAGYELDLPGALGEVLALRASAASAGRAS